MDGPTLLARPRPGRAPGGNQSTVVASNISGPGPPEPGNPTQMTDQPPPPPKRKPGRPRRESTEVTVSREKERTAFELWVRGATPSQVAATPWRDGQPMYRSHQGAQEAINRAAAYLRPIDGLEQLRTQSLARLQQATTEVWRVMGRRHPLRDARGQVVYVTVRGPDGTERQEPAEDDTVKLQAARVLERLDARIGALMGLDAAIKFEHSGPDGGPMEHEVRVRGLWERTTTIRLMPREEPIEATARDGSDEADEA